MGVRGNESADTAAKAGLDEPITDVKFPVNDLLTCVSQLCTKEWQTLEPVHIKQTVQCAASDWPPPYKGIHIVDGLVVMTELLSIVFILAIQDS